MKMKSFKSRSNARRAAQQSGADMGSVKVYELTNSTKAHYFGLNSEHVGRFVWVDASVKLENAPLPVEFCEMCGKVEHDGPCKVVKNSGPSLAELAEREADAAEMYEDEFDAAVVEADREELEGPHKEELEQDRAFVAPAENTLVANRAKSAIESPVKHVHAVADKMLAEAIAEGREPPRRKDVVNQCIADGVATHTARTQYQVWFKKQRSAAVKK